MKYTESRYQAGTIRVTDKNIINLNYKFGCEVGRFTFHLNLRNKFKMKYIFLYDKCTQAKCMYCKLLCITTSISKLNELKFASIDDSGKVVARYFLHFILKINPVKCRECVRKKRGKTHN